MKYLLPMLFFGFLLVPQLHKAQNFEEQNKRFDSIFFDAATNISPTDIDRAHKIADSLYRFSVSDTHKIRALMLSAMFYQTSGNSEKTIYFALEAEKMAIKTKDYNWQARILGFLSTEFQNIGILKEREEFIVRMGETVPKIKDEYQRALMYPMYYQEQAIFYIENKNDEKGWKYIDLAKKHLYKLPDSPTKFMLLGLNERVHGGFFLKLSQQPDSALVHYNRSVSFYEKAEHFEENGRDFLYSGMGQAYLMKNQDSLGVSYLKKAEAIADQSDNVPLRLEIYEVLSDYYKEKKETESYVYYLEKHKELRRTTQDQKVRPVEILLENLKTENKNLRYGQASLFVLSIILAIGIVWSFVRYRNKKKKDHRRFQEIIAKLKQNRHISANTFSVQEVTNKEPQPVKESEKREKTPISDEMEQKITEGLKNFENGTNFLNTNFSLADLASEIGVNTKYLSQVLNQNYGKDFNSYINELRVNYIIREIQENSEYMNYKISYMADKCGFSSHSKFTAIFRQITGLTPSVFLNYIEKSKKEAVIDEYLVESE